MSNEEYDLEHTTPDARGSTEAGAALPFDLKTTYDFCNESQRFGRHKARKSCQNRFTPTRKTNTEHSCANTITFEKGMGIFFPPAVPGNTVLFHVHTALIMAVGCAAHLNKHTH